MHPLFQEFLAYAATLRLQLIEKAVGPKGTLLDVGCGTGELLAVARARGWTTTGVEPVEQSARYAVDKRGLDVRAAMLEESGLPERTYDVVSAFHVVEHMVDASAFLRSISRWVRPGGYVVVEVPNWHSFHRRNAGIAWNGFRPLEHVGHYGPATLKATIRGAGLTPVMVRTPGFLWEKQTLDHQLDDLGLYRWNGRLRRLGRVGEHNGQSAIVPRRFTSRAFLGLQAIYNRLGVGQVVLGVARVD
jgi:SAM-dependent methyltransferase